MIGSQAQTIESQTQAIRPAALSALVLRRTSPSKLTGATSLVS
jgi:hypothetical protein